MHGEWRERLGNYRTASNDSLSNYGDNNLKGWGAGWVVDSRMLE